MPVKSVGRRFQDCLLFLGALTTAGAAAAGGCLLHCVAWRAEKLLVALLVVSFVFPVLFLSVNLILRKKYFEKLKKMKLKDGQEYLYSHREFARQKSEELLKQLRRIRFRSDWYAVCLGMSGACTAFCGGALAGNGAAVLIGIYAAYCCTFGFSRIRFSIKTLLSDFGKKYISFLHYPTVYALAKKAAAALGCRGKIKIFLNPGVNAGVADMDGVISLDLGAILLDMLSDEELYAVLLHEFAHLKGESDAAAAERRFYVWLCEDRNENALYALTPYMFAFLDALYLLNYELYAYTVSILKENEADSAIARYGNAEKGASGLAKLGFFELYEWEKGGYDEPPAFQEENAPEDCLKRYVKAFRERLGIRSEEWLKIELDEILSRSSSHPTLSMRLKTLGVTNVVLCDEQKSPELAKDCLAAMEEMEKYVYARTRDAYASEREKNFLKPALRVEEWEKANCPLVAHEYYDLIQDLRRLGRNSDAERLCERVIEQLPRPASCMGYYIKGCMLLSRYDEKGVELVYTAMENQNFIDEGIQVLGRYFCLKGEEKGLDGHRERATELAQKSVDRYSKLSTLARSDRLSREDGIPQQLLDEIVSHILSVCGKDLEKIYLVRKTLGADFSASVFVLSFHPYVGFKRRQEILRKVYCYLDTLNGRQFALFDMSAVLKAGVDRIRGSLVYPRLRNDD